MPKQAKKKNNKKSAPKNVPRKQPKVGATIVKGLAGIANQFLPGSGAAVQGIGKLLGFGAYTTAEAETLLASRVPSMNSTLDRGVRISHHEYLGDVMSSTGFSVFTYALNPGLSVTFPWLSTVAKSFQEYELNGCVFYFKATSANALNSTNTALGQIIGAVQYNPYMPAPINKIEMLGLSSASDGKPSECNVYPVECKADMVLFRSKLIRTDSAVTDDLAKYDHGNFFLGANGSQAAATVGELHIVYDITLKKPKLRFSDALTGWHFSAWSGADAASGAAPFAGAIAIADNTLGVTQTGASLNVFTIPANVSLAGTLYSITLHWDGDAAVIAYPTLTWTNAVAANAPWGSGLMSAPAAGVNSVSLMTRNYFRVSASNVPTVVTVGLAGTIPTNSSWQVIIAEEDE